MQPRILTTNEKKLIGQRLTMSLAQNKMKELWQGFSPRRMEIADACSNDLISLVVYAPDHFQAFHPNNEFERWAAVEVSHFSTIPAGMESFMVPAGLYAVFDYRGLNTDPSIFRYIFETWLPDSAYLLDNRPHFEVLGDRYKNNDPASEEELWIPVKPK